MKRKLTQVKYKFKEAFEDAIESIITTYTSHRKELNLYVHEDFLDETMNNVAEQYLNNTLKNVEVHLVSIIVYNETEKLNISSQEEIRKQIIQIIEDRYKSFDKSKIDCYRSLPLSLICSPKMTYICS